MGRPVATEVFVPVQTGDAAIDRAQGDIARVLNGLLRKQAEDTGSVYRDTQHGLMKMVLVPASGNGNSVTLNVVGYAQASSSAGNWIQTIPIAVGDRIRRVSFWHKRASTGTSEFKLQRFRLSDGSLDELFAISVTSGTSYEKVYRDYEHTIAEGYGYQLEWDAAASADRYYGAEIQYDRP